MEPEAVQIFGTEDQLVGDDDLQEVYQFTKVRTVVLKGFDHASFLTPPFPEVTENLDSTDFLSKYGTIRDSFDRATAPVERITRPAEAPRRVIVFLVHGIRDYADWQENVSYHLRKTFRREQVKDGPGVIATPSSEIEATPSSEIEVVPVRYGYFNAFQFLFPSQRRRSVRAFVDAYYQALARFPYVLVDDIHVMAHSNGTFVLGQALKQHREVRVNRVLLAGSVLPANFDWATLYREGRLREIHSDCGDVDWPVGLLCQGLSCDPRDRHRRRRLRRFHPRPDRSGEGIHHVPT